MGLCKIRSYNYVRAAIFGKKPTLTDRVVGWRSYPQTHTEWQHSGRYGNVSFSSTMMDKNKGGRFKDIGYTHLIERWDTVYVQLTDHEEDLAYNEAARMDGMPYDLVGQLCHLTKWKIFKPSKKKVWCTRAVGGIIYAARPDFREFLDKYGLVEELKPDTMHMMAGYYF